MTNIKNINLKNVGDKVLKNLSWLFFGVFLVLLFFGILEIKTSFEFVLKVSEDTAIPNTSKGVRINFENYNWVVNRIEQSDSFKPSGGITRDPFNPDVSLFAPPEPVYDDSSGELQVQ